MRAEPILRVDLPAPRVPALAGGRQPETPRGLASSFRRRLPVDHIRGDAAEAFPAPRCRCRIERPGSSPKRRGHILLNARFGQKIGAQSFVERAAL